ncbi:MAG: hypothetical protein DBX46_04545 [Clostridiales bacterium]|nr:MAG: hypothetical protein DBX46_04545 [Clostridiales bacterium]
MRYILIIISGSCGAVGSSRVIKETPVPAESRRTAEQPNSPQQTEQTEVPQTAPAEKEWYRDTLVVVSLGGGDFYFKYGERILA